MNRALPGAGVGIVVRMITRALSVVAVLLAAGCESAPDGSEYEPPKADAFIHPSGLVVEDLRVGTGVFCEPGWVITVEYTGALADGTVFDSTRPAGDHPGRGRAMTYHLDELMAGWREGVPGMRVGGERRLVIPPHLALGEAGRPPLIPPNAILEFTIELVDAHAPGDAPMDEAER